MGHTHTKPTDFRTAIFCIRTVLYQDLIAFHFKLYMYLGVGLILLLALAGKISLTAALTTIGIGGGAIICLMCVLIRARRESLLAIRDPELRQVAHEAMQVYLSRKHVSLYE